MYVIRNTLTNRLLVSSHSNGAFEDKPLIFQLKSEARIFIILNKLSAVYVIEEYENGE